MNTKEKIIEVLENKSDEEIEEEFFNLIEDMTDEQFWKWVSDWESVEDILDRAKDWEIETKKDEIINIRKNFLK